jgi:thymidylate kinase
MTDRSDARAVLITGVYGAGKTSVIEEMAEIFEEHAIRYAAIDLDWLSWFDAGGRPDDHTAAIPTMLKNVDAVVGNYYDTGVRVFALARTFESRRDIDDLQAALGMPLITVRLDVPLEEVERRLSTSVSSGRQIDLKMAREWFSNGEGKDVGDVVIANDRPLGDVAQAVLDELGWLDA